VFHQNKLSITTTLERVGNTSFTLSQTMINDDGDLAVSAEVVLATIDRQARTKTPVPEEIRNLLQQQTLLEKIISQGNNS
jgi:acyl-CoA thioesterase FadM